MKIIPLRHLILAGLLAINSPLLFSEEEAVVPVPGAAAATNKTITGSSPSTIVIAADVPTAFSISATAATDFTIEMKNSCSDDMSWECEDFGYGFYLGAEGTTVSEVSSEGTVRAEFYGYERINQYVHISGSVIQTNSQEASVSESAEAAEGEGPPEEEGEIKSAIVGSVNVIGYLGDVFSDKGISDNKQRYAIILNHNIKKSSGESTFNKEYYAGFRLARSKDQYFDILYGKNEAIDGGRLKVRGQLPINDKKNFFVGVVFNSGVKDTPEESGDTIMLYATVKVDVEKIFTNFTSD